MILRRNPDNGRSWNLGNISKRGLVWFDNLGAHPDSAGLLDLHKQYLKKVTELVPGAFIKTSKETGWYVTQDGKRYIPADTLLADEARKDGWTCAIADFQADVMQKSEGD
jgi:hypothetical protein